MRLSFSFLSTYLGINQSVKALPKASGPVTNIFQHFKSMLARRSSFPHSFRLWAHRSWQVIVRFYVFSLKASDLSGLCVCGGGCDVAIVEEFAKFKKNFEKPLLATVSWEKFRRKPKVFIRQLAAST